MLRKIVCIYCSIILLSCAIKPAQQDLPLDGASYSIDLDREKEASAPLSSLYKSVRTIILETGDDCMIGRISAIQVFDNHIFILDSRVAKSLFVFDSKGKFIRKIGNIGQGPGEYVEVQDFTLDTESCMIYLYDARNRVHTYQFDGTYLNSITMDAPDSQSMFIQYYNGSLYSSQIWWEKSEDNFMLLEVDPGDGKILSGSLPIKYNKGWNELYTLQYNRFFMSRANNPPRYSQIFMDFIVSIGKEITPYIELKSKNLATEEDIESFRESAYWTDITRSSKFFNVHCFVENDDFITFGYGTFRSPFTVIINKRTGESKLVNFLKNDLIYKDAQQGRFVDFRFADAKGAYVIFELGSFYGSSPLSNFQNAVMNDEIVSNLDKLDQLMNATEEDNPVIFFYEFK